MTTTSLTAPRRSRNRLRPLIWGGAACLLLLPAVAMRFDSGVNWTVGDFVVMGTLLALVCGMYELATRRSGSTTYRAGVGLALLAGFMTVWVNLAVGMYGSGDNPLNLMFGGVLLVAAVGALLARFRARGMAVAMGVTAAAQLLATATGLGIGLSGMGGLDTHGIWREAGLCACFALPWLASALLFRR